MADDEQHHFRRASDREFQRIYDELKELSSKGDKALERMEKLSTDVRVLDEWRVNHDTYYKRETQLVGESFGNVKKDIIAHEERLGKIERILEKHGVIIGIVSAVATAILIAVIQHLSKGI